MTPLELLAKIEQQKQERAALAKLWESLFPGCPVPGERQFTIWLNRYDFETVVAGLEKALQQEQRRPGTDGGRLVEHCRSACGGKCQPQYSSVRRASRIAGWGI